MALVGFSMGGAVGIRAAEDARVRTVIGVNPWLPDALDMSPLAGKELRVVHGSLDRPFPGVPGVSPELSLRGYGRARAAGAAGEYVTLRGGLHAVALRSSFGLLPLPRAPSYAAHVVRSLRRFAGSTAGPTAGSTAGSTGGSPAAG